MLLIKIQSHIQYNKSFQIENLIIILQCLRKTLFKSIEVDHYQAIGCVEVRVHNSFKWPIISYTICKYE